MRQDGFLMGAMPDFSAMVEDPPEVRSRPTSDSQKLKSHPSYFPGDRQLLLS